MTRSIRRCALACVLFTAAPGCGGSVDHDGKQAAADAAPPASDARADVRSDAAGGYTALDIPATQTFTDTGLELEAGEMFEVTASGTISFDSGKTTVGPDGYVPRDSDQYSVIRCPHHASLIGRIDQDGQPFRVGASGLFVATATGRLFLGVNDVSVADNSGAFAVRVTRAIVHDTTLTTGATIPGNVAWTDTDIDVDGEVVTIIASGVVDNHVGDPLTNGPDGIPNTPNADANVLKCANHAALIAKVDDNSPFWIGVTFSRPAPQVGHLYLGINDSILVDNGGKFAASIELSKR